MTVSLISCLEVLRGKLKCLAVGAILLTPAFALAQHDNDLILLGLSVVPNPLTPTCPARLTATLLVNGDEDHTLDSGDVQIRFEWREAGTADPWSLIGFLPVTWNTASETFAMGAQWPGDFPSASGKALRWVAPSTATMFEIRGTALYTPAAGVSDGDSSNNSAKLTVDSDTSAVCIDPDCIILPGHWHNQTLLWIWCWDELIPVISDPRKDLPCLLDPDCIPRWPPLCRVIPCPPCFSGLSCPREVFRLWIEDPPDVFKVILFDHDEQIVAVSEPLKRPIREEGRTYTQVLEFIPEQGVEYYVGLEAAEKIDSVKPHPFRVRLETPKGLEVESQRRSAPDKVKTMKEG